MMRDWSGHQCETLKILFPVGNIKDHETTRKIWLAKNLIDGSINFIRSNEIKRKCKSLIHENTPVLEYYKIKRTCYDGSVDYMTKVYSQFYLRSSAHGYADKDVDGIIKRLNTDWPGYSFEAIKIG